MTTQDVKRITLRAVAQYRKGAMTEEQVTALFKHLQTLRREKR